MGVHACAEPLRAEPGRAAPVPWDPGQGTSLLTRVAPPHRGRDIPGCDDPVTGLRRDPLGSTAVHAGPSPSSYTTHLAGTPGRSAGVGRLPRAGRFPSRGRSRRSDRDFTNPRRRGSTGTPGPQRVALTQPKSQAGPAVACSHAGSGPPWWRSFLYNGVAPRVAAGWPASSPARAPSVNKHIHPAVSLRSE